MVGLKAGIQINKGDLKNLRNKIASLANFPGTANDILRHEGTQAVGRIKRDSPFDTGRLRRAVELKVQTSDEIIIESEAIDPKTGIDYAPVREYGLDGHPPQPYFRHNIDLMFTKLRARISRKLEEISRKNSISGAVSGSGSIGSLKGIKNKLTKYLKT